MNSKREPAGLPLIAATTSGTWDWDIPAARLFVDDKFAELYSIAAVDAENGLPTSRFFEAIHPDDRPRIRIAVAGILAGAEVFSKEFRVVRPEGSIIWVQASGQTTFSENDEPVRFSGLLVDVTERKRTEERLRIAQSAGGIGTFEYMEGHGTVAVSDEFCRLLGLHPASVLPLPTVNGVLQGGQVLIPGSRHTHAPESIDAEFRIVRNDDGNERWIARRGEIIQEGSAFRYVGVIYDVTTAKKQEESLRQLNDTLESRVEQEVAIRQQAEEALRQGQKMEAVGQLTGGIAHDFNNLLMAITSSLSLLSKRIDGDPQALRLIENAQQGAQRGAALTQRMLAFARRQDLASEKIDLPLLVDGMRELLDRTLGPEWQITTDFPAQLPPVLADKNQLELALLNLAVNARDAMSGGGTILIKAESRAIEDGMIPGVEAGSYVGLSVVDHGEGMGKDILARATEPFFTTKGVGKGTGLGLSMIHGLAKQLRGGFSLESELSEGTTATLWLPIASADDAYATEPGHQPTPSVGRLTILAVDDDSLILMNMATMLEDLGHRVLEAHSGENALNLARDHPDIDLVISDQAMPNMTGMQLADRLTELHREMPFILATGYSDVPHSPQQRIVKLGKPYSQEMLQQAIFQAMEPAHRRNQ